MEKRRIILYLNILIIFILIGLVSANSCVITNQTSCTGSGKKIVMGLSSATNAHGELSGEVDENGYDYVLCCDFGNGDTTCTDENDDGINDNEIIGLSSETNAHAETPGFDNYDYDVCYGNMVCSGKTECAEDEKAVLSLYNETNSHIGNPEDYDILICCKSEGILSGVPYWTNEKESADINKNGISESVEEINVVLGQTKVFAIMKDSGLAPESSIIIEIYERDLLGDDLINVISSDVDEYGDIKASWLISEADLENGVGGLGDASIDDLDELYFIIKVEGGNGGIQSENEIKLKIVESGYCISLTGCADYSDAEKCEGDICNLSYENININNPSINCNEEIYSCGCEWDTELEECGPYWEINNLGEDEDEEDIDGDGILNVNDSDIDGDGIANKDDPDFDDDGNLDWPYENIDSFGDIDSDGKYNIDDSDMDGDGIINGDDPDFDDDGFIDEPYEAVDPDGDIDGDGILNIDDSDMDGDGIANRSDPDFDGDGDLDGNYAGEIDPEEDIDSDGILNIDDSDMDGDGIINGDDPDFDDDGVLEQFIATITETGTLKDISIIGKCTYNEDTGDDCEDGFLEYSWLGVWKWNEYNLFDSNPGGNDYVESEDGWHYDPEKKNQECIDGSETIPCPSQVELPFFGFYSFIATILLIAIIYVFLNRRLSEC